MESNEVTIVAPDYTSLQIRAEIDAAVATAKAFPRSIKVFMDRALSMATITEDIAQSCTYALPRGGKSVEGPSVRLAEIVCSSYGNIRAGARVVENDGRTITAQGIAHDLENNYSVTVEVKRSILQHEWAGGVKTGRMITMNDDMQVVIGNAACAIAYRNAVFKVVPAALAAGVYDEVKKVAKGTAATLVARRTQAIYWFRESGVKDTQICAALGIKKVEDIDLDKLAILSGMRAAVKNGESTLKELFEQTGKEPEGKKATYSLESLKEMVRTGTVVDDLLGTHEISNADLKELRTLELELFKNPPQG